MLTQLKGLLVVAVFLLVSAPATAGAVAGYGDVPADTYFSEPVQWSVDNSITGIESACFSPDKVVTRIEAARWIWQTQGQPSAPVHSFSDVDESGPVSWMVDRGITTGTSPSTFSPNDPLTRAHLVTFLYRYRNEPTVTINPNTPICTTLTFTAIDIDNVNTCGLQTDGTVTCWGRNAYGQSDAPAGTFTAVDVSDEHACGLRTDRTVTCWGRNAYGESDAPAGTFAAVDVSGNTAPLSCGLRTDRTVTCWGYDGIYPPVGTFASITAGGHLDWCGIRTDGTVKCWGRNDQSDVPAGTFASITGGYGWCGIRTDGTVTCWRNRWFEGDALAAGTFTAVTVTSQHACGIRTDGTVTCWGSLFSTLHDPPRLYEISGTFTAFISSYESSCGLRTDGTVKCWGVSTFGEAYPPPGTFTAIAGGHLSSCGLRTDGTVTCWGRGYDWEYGRPENGGVPRYRF